MSQISSASTLPMGNRRAARNYTRSDIEELDKLARLLDAQWRIPGVGVRVGLDALVGLLPGIGDAAVGVVGSYIIFRAWRFGVPVSTLARMGLNLGLDTVFGSIPILGSVFDVFYKANLRNMRLLRSHLERNLDNR